VTRASLVLGVLLLAAVAALYAGTAEWAAVRYGETDSYYSHGFLVWPVAGFLFWRALRRSSPAGAAPRAIGFVPLLLGLLLLLASHLQRLHVTAGLSLLPVLYGFALLLGGDRAARAARFPILFALSGVPLPLYLLGDATLELKTFASGAAAALLSALGLDARVSGSTLHVEGAELLVGDPCSGLRSLIALVSIGALFSHLSGLGRARRCALFLLSAPFALLSNVFRIAILGAVAGLAGEGAARAAHDASGLLVYAGALGLLALAAKLLRRRGGARAAPPEPTPALAPPGAAAAAPRGLAIPLAAAACVGLAWPVALRLERPAGTPIADVDLAALPSVVGPWTGTDVAVTPRTLDLLGTEDVLLRSYRHEDDGREAYVCVVYSSGDRKAVHPPEVCYRGGGGEILERATVRIGAGADAIDANAILVVSGPLREVILYWYKFGDEFETSYLTQQWRMAVGAFLGREGSAALVRLSAVVEGGDDANVVVHRLAGLGAGLFPSLRASLP